MNIQCKIVNLYKRFNAENEGVVELQFGNISALAELEEIKNEGKLLDVDIKIHRKKRSLNANSYLWHLLGEISEKLNIPSEEVYIIMLKRYGKNEVFSVKTEIDIKIKYYEVLGQSKINETMFTHYKVFKGTSEYDSKEMTILLNGVVEECKQLNITTLEDREIERLVREWDY